MVIEVAAGKLLAFRQIAARLAAGKEALREPPDPLLGGLQVGQWFVIFDETHAQSGMGTFIRLEWPEEGGYAEQPAVVMVAFRLVEEAKMKEAEQASG